MIKTLLFLIAISFSAIVIHAQAEKEINSEIHSVIVYTEGAQIERVTSITLQSGQNVYKLTNLSPFIKKESIRIEGDGSFTLLNVQHQNDFIHELEKNKEIKTLEEKIDELKRKAEDESTWIRILSDKIDFLNVNKQITGKEQVVSPETFNAIQLIYGTNMENLQIELLKRQRQVDSYNKEILKLENQLSSIHRRVTLPSGTIILTIESKTSRTATLKVNYLVDNASWYPSYDIRYQGADKPLQVTYKANILQNTGVDWKNVDLTLSTAKTNISAQIPDLNPYYLRFFQPKRIADALQGRVAGLALSADKHEESEMRIRGIESVSASNQPLYIVDGVAKDDISYLSPDEIRNMEVIKDASSTAIYGSKGENGVVLVTTKKAGDASSVPLTIASKGETSIEYLVNTPQSIPANNKLTSINFKESSLKASFQYQSVPKLSGHVFLIGAVDNWYQADLMDGEANLYLENSYVGKSYIDTRQFTDTLNISFGIDNHISIKREKLSEFSQSQTLGTHKKETLAYQITVRNNKSFAVTAKVTDQVPVSMMKDIVVEHLELSGGTLNPHTGEINWQITIEPKQTREIILKYSVKYPKDKRVILE